jgi:hypothetical protein
MRKIKIIQHKSERICEAYVNQFLAEHPKVIDIQMQYGTKYGEYVVMIVYEEVG